ncbi:DinB family protein [Arcticibacter tournemirensis]|uniref:Damage-inducible protein DinB n=1 Tax=Arcticibacter tournemirensis TaxID=699437 RepID=A0A4V1KI53_9SPHI|nr:DinB family protein [Arcticibacter tournemirensis]RXF69492.1 damage-inducible protein DinB [Arcticibacter tournemirensis]
MLKELMKYTDLADKKMIGTFKKAGVPLPEAERLFSHILNSQYIWACRIRGEKTNVDRFDLLDVSEFDDIQQRNMGYFYQLLENADLSAAVSYSNSQGEAFTDAIEDILFHVVNHSTYHRAQVATQFRVHGIKPPVTDYIHLKRQGEL